MVIKMKIRKIIIIAASILTVYMCGCSAAGPEYFDVVTETVERNWTSDEFEWWPTNVLLREQNNTVILHGGGSVKQGVLDYYIRDDDMYYQFDLSEQFPGHEQWEWMNVGAFRKPEDNITFLCMYDFDWENARTPDLIIVEFPAEHPENYTAQLYTLGEEDSFLIDVTCCYSLGDSIYMMWRDNHGKDRLCAIQQDKGQLQDLGDETALLEQYARGKSSASFVGQYCVLSENDGVTIYGADVREASDMPPVSYVLMAVKEGKPLAGIHYDLMLNEAPKAVLEQFQAQENE